MDATHRPEAIVAPALELAQALSAWAAAHPDRALGDLEGELLSGDRLGFDRITHRAGWEKRLTALVENNRNRPATAGTRTVAQDEAHPTWLASRREHRRPPADRCWP